MSDPNPYESPQTQQPLTAVQVVKRGIGVSAMLLLTPPAMLITVAASCKAAAIVRGNGYIVLGVPVVVLAALMLGAAAFRRRDFRAADRRPSGTGILLVTPVVVAISYAIGYVFAALVASVVGGTGGGDAWLTAAMIAFWIPPAIVLLAMLGLAWRRTG